MIRWLRCSLCALMGLSIIGLCPWSLHCRPLWAQAANAVEAAAAVDYARDIAPVLARNCVACHNAKKTEGGLNLETHAALMAGGDSGAAVEATRSADSYLVARVLDTEDPMPPKDNAVGAKPLTAAELDLLNRWIDAGAPAPSAAAQLAMKWQAIPQQLAPIYALDASADSNYLAVGHGNTVEVVGPWGSGPQDPHAMNRHTLIDGNLQLADGAPLAATHLDLVQSLAFSPDNQTLATGGYRTVKLWRRQTAAREVLAGVSAGNGLTAISPTGQRVAAVVAENGIELVDLQAGLAHRFLKSHASPVTALAWLSEQYVLSADSGGGLTLFDVRQHQFKSLQLSSTPAHLTQLIVQQTRLFAVDAAGGLHELLNSAGQPGLTTAWNAGNESLQTRQIALNDKVTAVTPFPTAELGLLVAMSNQTVQRLVIAADSGASTVAAEFKLDERVQAMSLPATQDGEPPSVLTISDSGQAKLRKLSNGELLAALDRDYTGDLVQRTLQRNAERQAKLVELLVAQVPELQKASETEVEAHKKVLESRDKASSELETKKSELTTAQTAVSETEQALAAAEKRVAELKTELENKRKASQEMESKRNEAQQVLAQREQALATAAEGVQRAAQRIAELEQRTADQRKTLSQYETAAEEAKALVHSPAAHNGVFSANGALVAIANADHHVRLYQTRNGAPVANLSSDGQSVWGLRAADDGALYAVSAEGRVLQWDLQLPWSLLHSVGSVEQSPFSDRITALDFSPDGRWLAIGSGPPSRFGEVQVLDVATATISRNFGEVHSDSVLSVRFSPDGRLLASVGADKLCRLWQVETGEALRTLEGHTHHVLSVAWQDNGQSLATAGADQVVKVWKVESAEQLRTISGFSHEVSAVEFVGNTNQLLAVCADGSARLINADDGKTIRSFAGAQDALYALSVSADATEFTAGGQVGRTWTWNVADGKSVEKSTPSTETVQAP